MEKTKMKLSLTIPVITGLLISITVMILGCLLSGWLIHSGAVEEQKIGYLTMGIIFLGGTCCGATALAKANSKVLITGCVAGITVFLVMLLSGMLFFDGTSRGVGETVFLLLGADISTILVGIHRRGKSKNRHRRIRNG